LSIDIGACAADLLLAGHDNSVKDPRQG
jgi:hypothetical protein